MAPLLLLQVFICLITHQLLQTGLGSSIALAFCDLLQLPSLPPIVGGTLPAVLFLSWNLELPLTSLFLPLTFTDQVQAYTVLVSSQIVTFPS